MHSLWQTLEASFDMWLADERLWLKFKRGNLFQWMTMEIDRCVRLMIILEQQDETVTFSRILEHAPFIRQQRERERQLPFAYLLLVDTM